MHARKRGVESFEKREKDVKRGKNKEKNMCMRERKRIEREKRSSKKDMRGMNQVKKNKVQGRMSRC
jgi:hypothetical protein